LTKGDPPALAFELGATINASATGDGVTQAEAVAKALSQAIQQATGVYVETRQNIVEANGTPQELGGSVRRTLPSDQSNIRMQTGAFVKSYVIESMETGAGRVSVRLSAEIEQYKSRLSFTDARPRLLIDKLTGKNDEANDLIYAGVMEKLVKANRFAMVDRRYLDRYQKEMDLIRSAQVTPADKHKFGQMLGADYILNIESAGLSCQESSIAITLTKEVEQFRTCRIETAWQLSELATSVVVSANRFTSNTRVNLRLANKTDASGAPSDKNQLVTLTETVAATLSTDILDGLFPLFIESFNAKTALIHRGDKALKEGERFQIFRVVQEGASAHPLKFWGAKLQLAGELQIVKIDGGAVVGNILTADFNRDGDFVLKPIASQPSSNAAAPAKGKPSSFD
jgi:hypothetical protein